MNWVGDDGNTFFAILAFFLYFNIFCYNISVSCDIEFNCHHNANCDYVENEGRSKCICSDGYEGNGYECAEEGASCLFVRISDSILSRLKLLACSPSFFDLLLQFSIIFIG